MLPDWQAQMTAIVRQVELDFAALNDQFVQVKVQFRTKTQEPVAVKVGKPTTKANVTPVVTVDRNALPPTWPAWRRQSSPASRRRCCPLMWARTW